MYRLYAQRLQGSYDKIGERKTLEEIEKLANGISQSEYYSYMIIKNEGNGDEIVTSQKLYERVKVEIVDKDETSIEVKTKVFQPSRMKKKEELRKLTEGYIDRWD